MASSFWSIASRQAVKSGVFLTKVYCLLHVTTNHLGFFAYAYGPSMIPTLHPSGNVVLAERISLRFQKLDRGDIVVIRSPESPRKMPMKRVVGIEGDHITFVIDPEKSHKSQTIVIMVYYNGRPCKFFKLYLGVVLKTSKRSFCSEERIHEALVPKGHLWVQGDFTLNSRDSRAFGPVPYGLIQGRVLWRVWPLQDIGRLGPNPNLTTNVTTT